MKQRLTFIVPEGTFIDVKTINVDQDAFNFTAAPGSAGVEQRTTLSLNELPKTIRRGLQDVHELHIRWTRWTAYEHLSPLVSRQPPGLHVYFTPRDGTEGAQLCSLLQDLFDKNMKCESVLESFSKPAVLSERFASSATYQFYYELGSLDSLLHRLTDMDKASTTQYEAAIDTIYSATEVNLDFDIISHALVITATWPRGIRTQEAHIHGFIDRRQLDSNVEIGVLAAEQPDEAEELKLGGYLTVLGEDTKPSATLFSFPSRHHPLPAKDSTVYNASFLKPAGLHPTLALSFPRHNLKPPYDTCVLHAYMTLPSALFLDRYQLSDQALLAEKNVRALHALSGAEDLEAPDWLVKQWGSASLLELAHPGSTQSTGSWEVQIPLHLRYLRSENTKVIAPWPIIFWACEAEEGLKMSTNPFDRVNIGYDGLFGPKTMFYHIPPGRADLTLSLRVPVLDPATASWLPYATWTVVLAGLAWVLWSLIGPAATATYEKDE